jgi:signal transduction histidine kinase
MNLDAVADRLLTPDSEAFLSLPVVDEERRPLGLVSRHHLQNVFMQRFGRELWGKRPVRDVMNSGILALPLDTGLEAAARQVTAHLGYPVTEDFLLLAPDGTYLGLGTVIDLLKAMEARIDQRNRALQQTLVNLRESQAQLVQSEKMASLGQMVAGVAHELNTPLGYVSNNVQLVRELIAPLFALLEAQATLADCLEDPACDERRLGEAMQHAARMREEVAPQLVAADLEQLFEDTAYGLSQIAELVGGLKDFARLDRATSEDVDLNECVRSALLIARNNLKGKVEVIQQLDALPPIPCVPSQINQVLLNLLNNAAQAIEGTGKVLIKSWVEPEAVCLSVEDNGCGMPPEVVARIFDPFFTTKPVGQGTGLGLSISYKIVEDHGGSLRVKSVPGRGTRFVIRHPVNPPASLERSA